MNVTISEVETKAALEKAVAAFLGAPYIGHIVYENEPYDPVAGQPYAEVNIEFARPGQHEVGGGSQGHGLMDVLLYGDLDAGRGALGLLADTLRIAFKSTTTFTEGSTTVQVHLPPERHPGIKGVMHYCVPVRVPFQVNAA